MQKLIKGAKLDMVNKQKEFKKTKKNIKGLTTIDMQKLEENKEKINKSIKKVEEDIKKLENSDDEIEKKLAKLFRFDLELYKNLTNNKDGDK